MAGTANQKQIENFPKACQYEHLCSSDNHSVKNESADWLSEQTFNVPLWSRLRSPSHTERPRSTTFAKKDNFEIEIPDRLLSLFGNHHYQTNCMNRMENIKNCQLLSCVFCLCAALKNDFKEWSMKLLDLITTSAIQQYPKLLKKLSITDKELQMSQLGQVYNFDGAEFETQLQQVLTGYLYMRYGLDEFNLARALMWFFGSYQFGLIQCRKRSLAFGYILDNDYGFFMYDCQSRGHPLFKKHLGNTYILRTNHLQILLYCITMTFNIPTEVAKFVIHNVDVRISNPSEKPLKKETYIPTIIKTAKNLRSKKTNLSHLRNKFNRITAPKKLEIENKYGHAVHNPTIENTTKKLLEKKDQTAPKPRTPSGAINSNRVSTLTKNFRTANSSNKILNNSNTSVALKRNSTVTAAAATAKAKSLQNVHPLYPAKMYSIVSVPTGSQSFLGQKCTTSNVKCVEKFLKSSADNIEDLKAKIRRIGAENIAN